MANIEDNSKHLEENISMPIEEKPQTDIAGNDITSLLMARLDAMESKYLEMSKPVVKKKREPSEKQKLALEQARIKKMENFAIRKQLKEDKKKELKQQSKVEVEEYKKKSEIKPDPIVENVEEIIDVVPTATEPTPVYKTSRKSAPPLSNDSIGLETYHNKPVVKSSQRGLSAREKMALLFA